jgi:hypothetical protein
MKRHIVAALIIGLIVAGLIIGVEIAGWLAAPGQALANLFPETTKRLVPAIGYVIVAIVAAGVAFLSLATSQRNRMLLIVGILFVELLGVAWVCSLYKLEFQALPAMAAAILAYVGVIAFVWFEAYLEERRSRPPKIAAGPTPRPAPISVVPEGPTPVPVVAPPPKPVASPPPVVEKPRARARRSDAFSDSGARVCEVTAVVCDLANKHDLAEECEPSDFAEITERFISHAVQ